uniref:Uncharacterized protein n=1 Tax=Ditylenchus dipsaci TaxID=166011 RepID=A0A915EK19_9BILA
MNSGNRLENFRPPSPPISLLSYNAISTGAAPQKPTCAAVLPKQNSSTPTETSQPTNEVASNRNQSRVSLSTTTPTNAAKNIKQKTVAFGLTTNVSDTVEKNKNTPSIKNAVQRISRPLMASTREVEEIHKQLRSHKEEKVVDDLRSDEAKLSRALTSISSRLMELEKHRHSQSSNASSSSQQPVLAAVPVLQQLSLQEKKQQRHNHSSEGSRVQQISPVEQPQKQDKQVIRKCPSYPTQDERKIDDFLSFIKRRIRENPDFEARINRTVTLFGGGPDVNSIPTTMSENQRMPLRMDPTNETNPPSSYYGAKYTQRLTLHKEITTFSPDRGHLVRNPPSTRHSNDENFFVDEESDQEVMDINSRMSGPSDRRIIIFSTPALIKFLENSKWWGFDGTFALVPKGWKQLLTLHAKQGESFIPCLHALLPKKSRRTYDRFFAAVHQLVPDSRVRHAHMDFERTLIASFEHHYNFYVPTIDLHEAFSLVIFHYARNTDGRDKFEIGSGEARHGSGASEAGVQCFPMSCGIAFNSLERKFQDNKFVGSMALCIETGYGSVDGKKPKFWRWLRQMKKECSLKESELVRLQSTPMKLKAMDKRIAQKRKELAENYDSEEMLDYLIRQSNFTVMDQF